jgi:hypothetical protein
MRYTGGLNIAYREGKKNKHKYFHPLTSGEEPFR